MTSIWHSHVTYILIYSATSDILLFKVKIWFDLLWSYRRQSKFSQSLSFHFRYFFDWCYFTDIFDHFSSLFDIFQFPLHMYAQFSFVLLTLSPRRFGISTAHLYTFFMIIFLTFLHFFLRLHTISPHSHIDSAVAYFPFILKFRWYHDYFSVFSILIIFPIIVFSESFIFHFIIPLLIIIFFSYIVILIFMIWLHSASHMYISHYISPFRKYFFFKAISCQQKWLIRYWYYTCTFDWLFSSIYFRHCHAETFTIKGFLHMDDI